jgi:hypothetical protein
VTLREKKRRDEGLVEKRKRQSGCPVRPRDPLPVPSPLPTMGKWLKMDGGLTRAAGYERR